MGSRHQPATCTYVCYPIRIPFQSPDLARMPSSLASNHYLQSPEVLKKSSHLNRCLRVLHGIPNMAGLCNPPPQVVLLKLSSAHAEQRAKKRNRCDFRLALGFGSLLFAIFSMQLACECRKFERSQVDEWLGWLGYASVRRRCETISRCLIRHLCWSSANEKIRCTLFFLLFFF